MLAGAEPYAASALAAAWLLAHLPFLAPALEDIDSINFALGLHHYDPALHQPHPPGYPVFIAAGRLSLAAVQAAAPALSHLRADALALAIWSAIGGAIALVACARVFREISSDPERAGATALWGAALVAATPLFWMTGLRPMSDMFGLGIALAAQALLLCGARDRRWLVAGAAVAGLAAGIRTQTVPLTVPLFIYAVFAQRRQGTWLVWPFAAMAAGGLVWVVPLLAATGGAGGYLRALGSQAGEDFAWADMLWMNPAPRAIAIALYDTFFLPFGSPALGVLVVAAAALGGIVLLARDRRALLLLSVAFGPYALFHLLFQEAANLRYATPLIPLVIYPLVRLATARPRPRSVWPLREAGSVLLLVLLLAGFLPPALSAGALYGREPHPAFRAIADMEREAVRAKPGAVFSHYALRRPLQAAPTSLPVVEPVRNYEWLGPAEYWLGGGRDEIWFVADPGRTDLALIDPQVRKPAGRVQYRWSVAARPELMGTRPLGVDWYRMDPPGWFAGEGWELTPETAGIARISRTRLFQRPITAYVRRRSGPMTAIVAGRDLSVRPAAASMLEVAIDGTVVDSWRVDPESDGIRFFHLVQLPNGIPGGTGDYATLTVSARAARPGEPTPEIAVEQFDIQPVDTVMFGFGDGWHEAEYNNRTGLAWRWTSDRSVLRVVPSSQAVTITLRGESPLKYFDSPPTVRARAGDRDLAAFRPDRDFTWTVSVPADALVESNGLVTIETDQVYLPGQAEGTGDARRLGLRIFETQVQAAAR